MYTFRDFIDKNSTNNVRGTKNIRFYKKKATVLITIRGQKFGGQQVSVLLSYIGFVMKKYGKMCRKLVIYFEKLYPEDKLSYIILEYIVFELFKYYKDVCVKAGGYDYDISTHGFQSSPLFEYIAQKISAQEYCKKYSKILNHNHYRKIISENDEFAVSNLMSEVKTFLKPFSISEDAATTIAKITSELADNAGEHAKSECLVDIDISSEYQKEGVVDEKYYCVNICALNFSDTCLDDIVREKIVTENYKGEERYKKVFKAYDKHKKFFDNNYTDEHFFMLAAFQNKISGRKEITESGGVGLYEMISVVEKNADMHNCYVLSKDKVIRFFPLLLVSNKDNWVGFNKEHDFLNMPPDMQSINWSNTYLMGTGYNLTLIYRSCD